VSQGLVLVARHGHHSSCTCAFSGPLLCERHALHGVVSGMVETRAVGLLSIKTGDATKMVAHHIASTLNLLSDALSSTPLAVHGSSGIPITCHWIVTVPPPLTLPMVEPLTILKP
jgi:hypothetical protein